LSQSWIVDEDAADRDTIRHMLALTPAQRLESLRKELEN